MYTLNETRKNVICGPIKTLVMTTKCAFVRYSWLLITALIPNTPTTVRLHGVKNGPAKIVVIGT